MTPPPDDPIANIQDFLKCLDKTKTASLMVYAEKMGDGHGVGHAFISLKQGTNIMTFGFYPKCGSLVKSAIDGPGIMGDDSGHNYTLSYNYGDVNVNQLNNIIELSNIYASSDYILSLRNCSDFVLDVLNLLGINNNVNGINNPNDVINILSSRSGAYNANGQARETNRTCK